MSLLLNNFSTLQQINGAKVDETYFFFADNFLPDGSSDTLIYNSGDVAHWSVANHLGHYIVRDCAFFPGGICALSMDDVNSTATTHISTNGFDWELNPNGPANCAAIAYGNNIFVAVGSLYDPVAQKHQLVVNTSTDGLTWNPVTNFPVQYGFTYNVNFLRDRFVIWGSDYTVSQTQATLLLCTSLDGQTWTSSAAAVESLVAGYTITNLNIVKYANHKFIAFSHAYPTGNPLGTPKLIVIQSTDGVVWTAFDIQDIGYPSNFYYFNNKYVFFVSDFSNKVGKVYTSPDLINWTAQTDVPVKHFHTIRCTNTKFVVIGPSDDNDSIMILLESYDLVNWNIKKQFAFYQYNFFFYDTTNSIELVAANIPGAAPLYSPTFFGNPTVPTALTSDNSTTIASTAYVQAALAAGGAAGMVSKAGDTMTGTLILSSDPVPGDSVNIATTKHYVDTAIATAVAGVTGTGPGYVPVNKAGDTMTGLLVLSGNPTANLGAATKQYVDSADALKLNISGGTLTGALTLAANPTSALHAATKQYVDSMAGSGLAYTPVNKAGDTMTGSLILSNDPIAQLGAATKQYVDTQVVSKLSLGGGTMSGQLILSGNPTSSYGAATKSYVDSAVAGVSGGSGGVTSFNGRTGAVTLTSADITPLIGTFGTMAQQNANSVAITGGTITGATVNGQTIGSNATGTKTISSSAPSGGSNGDVWYQI